MLTGARKYPGWRRGMPTGRSVHLPSSLLRAYGGGERKGQKARDVRRELRGKIAAAVAEAFPSCSAELFGGVERSRMASLGPTLGFRIKHSRGKYRSNVIWFDRTYEGEVNAAWVADRVKQSNG